VSLFKAKLHKEETVGIGNRGRLRTLTYGFENGAVQAYDLFDVRATMQGSAGVVPLDAQGNVYLVREFLPALGAFGLSIPRGGIEPGEAPIAAAQRELKEEAGLQCSNLEPLWAGVVIPNASSWRVNLFLGHGAAPCLKEGGDEVGGTETIKMPLQAACAMVTSGEIPGALTGLALRLAQGKQA
jgi:8-oxo-dGTP pyrophosphatase MutT (NUDIX family)